MTSISIQNVLKTPINQEEKGKQPKRKTSKGEEIYRVGNTNGQ